jgi:two-component system, NarL family, nitrate/nitrite response regulator NarL
MAAPLRIALVEDDPDVRSLIELLLDVDERFVHIGSATDGASGVTLVAELAPDAVILDLELPGLSGLDAARLIGDQSPGTRIVVFSAFPDPITLIDVLKAGVDAYLDKARAWAELLPTIAAVCADSLQRR